MDVRLMTEFFLWCTLIDGALLLWWTLWLMLAPQQGYRIQSRFFPLSRQRFDELMYGFLGFFKILFIVFNLVPCLVLVIIG
ncbi:MAG: DUF6868 family protein [Candidatus Sedimenticola endophacoides]